MADNLTAPDPMPELRVRVVKNGYVIDVKPQLPGDTIIETWVARSQRELVLVLNAIATGHKMRGTPR